MSMHKWCLWAVLVAVGCNGKLTVYEREPGAAGAGGGGAGAGEAGEVVVGGTNGGQGGTVSGGGAGANTITAGRMSSGGTDGDLDALGGAAGDLGLAGAPEPAPPPGTVGQLCVPGGSEWEAESGPATAVIRTLARCYDGVSCDSLIGICVPTRNCPSDSDTCVLRRAAIGSYRPADQVPGSGGSGGAGLPNAVPEIGVVALTASESHVYWLEYGTRDPLGNYNYDGALMSYSMLDGTTAILASGLVGPMGLKLTTSHAYVYIDGAPQIGSPINPKLIRVPLSGGSATLVQDGARPVGFAAANSRAFWSTGDKIYSMSADSNAVPTVFLEQKAYQLLSDGTDLYFDSDSGLMRTAIASATPTALGLSASEYALYGEGIYSLRSDGIGTLLSRAPKAGGDFVQVRALGNGSGNGLRIVGDRYFFEKASADLGSIGPYAVTKQVLTAGFSGSDVPIRLLARTEGSWVAEQLWVGTNSHLYWSDGRTLYKQPLPTP